MCATEAKLDSEKCNKQRRAHHTWTMVTLLTISEETRHVESMLCQLWPGRLPNAPCAMRGFGGQKVPNQKCIGIKKQPQTEKPQSYKVCSPGPCPYWRAAKWGHCSVSCGHGIRMRHVECMGQIVDDSLCMKPMKHKTSCRCVLLACTCSESCGAGGVSRRNLHCIDTRNGHKLDARFCEGVPHEPIETECNRTPCPRWVYSQWFQCSRSCGGGLRMRHASCQDAAGRELDVRMCAAEAKLESEKCNEQPCTRWHFGQWSPCSVSCGDGVQRREAMCVRESDAQRLEEKDCEPRERIVEKQCQMAACPHWSVDYDQSILI
ncbi:hypothetical protein niasHS_000990 [Heterodera schachtii]|uniref:Uncharacterized protein n=1 Tax=Heterodera schachtii TaxID=97005 RepID=A0ABD2K7W8_HETSC